MEKRAELYHGKMKTVYSADNPDLLVLKFRNDTSTSDDVRVEQFDHKGMVNNKLSRFIISKLAGTGISTQVEALLPDTECLMKRSDMVPVGCVVRDRATDSLVKRLGIEGSTELNSPLFDLFLKSGAIHDPMINDFCCEIFGWMSKENLARMRGLTYKADDTLKKLLDNAGLILTDFKLEFGLFKGGVVLGNEFSPDGNCLWDKNTFDRMDEDRFCQNPGGLIGIYEEVAHCLDVRLD